MTSPRNFLALLLAAAIAAGGCSTTPVTPRDTPVAPLASKGVLRSVTMDRALEDRILALDPAKVSAEDVRNTLSKAPAPRIVSIHGGVFPVYLAMVSFGTFLTRMGYPEDRIRTPDNGDWSVSPYESASRIAGMLAWYYERDGVRPMIVGHSQGGIQAVKVLHELAGAWATELHPFNPVTHEFDAPTTFVDPLTGRERPVLGFSISYVAAVGTGGWALALPNHWIVVDRVRTIPDTVDEFEGFRIGFDLWALDGPAFEEIKSFHPSGSAIVRNVWLPAQYAHVIVPVTADLALSPEMRAWIDAFVPDNPSALAPLPDGPSDNVMFAANVWYGIKKHWALEAQRFVRARRALPPG